MIKYVCSIPSLSIYADVQTRIGILFINSPNQTAVRLVVETGTEFFT